MVDEISSVWKTHIDKYRESVLQVFVTSMEYELNSPYKKPKHGNSRGSGFLINTKLGLLMTNCHVVADATNVIARCQFMGQYDIRMRILSVCKEADLAICQIYAEDLVLMLKSIGRPVEDMDIPFGDNFRAEETEEVLAIGYPLGQEKIKCTPGHISGFHANVGEESDNILSFEESSTYVQVTAAINPGNSGGPIINRRGEVIAVAAAGYMFLSNIAYGIGARTCLRLMSELMSVLSEKDMNMPPLLKNHSPLIPMGGRKDEKTNISFPRVIHTPRVAFSSCKTNSDLIDTLVPKGSENITGIYVTKVNPDSVFGDLLKEGDLITTIAADVYANCTTSKTDTCSSQIVIGRLDNYGDIAMDSSSNLTITRRLNIKELLDIIPIGNRICLGVWRNKKLIPIEVTFTRATTKESVPLHLRFFHFEPLKWCSSAGFCFCELTLNHILKSEGKLNDYALKDKRYKSYVLICEVFPGTEAHRTKAIEAGSILDTINSISIRSIEEVKMAFKTIYDHKGSLTIKTIDRDIFMINNSDMERDNNSVNEVFI